MNRTEHYVNTSVDADDVVGMQPDAAAVARFLRRHPGFLAENPALYAGLHPPRRVHGDVLSDHMAAMVAQERSRSGDHLVQRRAEAGLTARVQDAVLGLLRAADPIAWLHQELPARMGAEAATLCVEGGRPRATWLPPRTVARLLAGRSAVVRQMPTDARLLHGAAAGLAQWDALVRVPLPVPALLALACRDGMPMAAGCAALGFLGRALAAALEAA